MKRPQIMTDDELNRALERKVLRRKTSKAALAGEYIRKRLHALPPLESDPLWRMAGSDDYEPGSVDDVVSR